MAESNITLREDLCSAANYFHDRGWMWGTGGNLSARIDRDRYWVTASGKSKGNLTPLDFINMSLDGNWEATRTGDKPSAETSIHQAIYSLFPEAQACYHVHSIEANLVSNFAQEDELLLPPLEMVKGLGIWEEKPTCSMALFENHLHVPTISQTIKDRFSKTPPAIPALLIRNHGVTVWGHSTEKARNNIELVEYIFRYMVLARQTIGPGV
jgi:methylthioribulose-1-phosphate dehydratase